MDVASSVALRAQLVSDTLGLHRTLKEIEIILGYCDLMRVKKIASLTSTLLTCAA